jgi:hypothetical protein
MNSRNYGSIEAFNEISWADFSGNVPAKLKKK